MTRSSILLKRVRNLTTTHAGTPLAEAARELADEYEQSIRDVLRLERTIHLLTKGKP